MKFIRQLIDEGVDPSEIARRVRNGEYERVRRGVLDTPRELKYEAAHLRLVRATLSGLTPGFVLSHQSAAAVYGLPVPARDLELTHVTREGTGGGRRTGCVALRRAPLPAEDVTTSPQGWPITTLERTAWDLARELTYGDAVAVVDKALRLKASRERLLERCDTGRHRRGKLQAQAAIRFGDGRSESPGESWSRVIMHQQSIPIPDLQVEIIGADARTDFGWHKLRLAGEFDGETKYGHIVPGDTYEDAMRREKAREQRIWLAGWWIVRWGWVDLRRPERFAATIKQMMAVAYRGHGHRR